MDVGDFTPTQTTDPEAEPDTFTYFGEQFDIPATVGAGSLLQFTYYIKMADGQAKRGDAALRKALTEEAKMRANVEKVEAELNATSAVYKLLASCLGESQMDRLLRAVDANGVQPEGLMELCNNIQEAVAARPTRRSADSSAGPSTNGSGSTDAGSGPTETPLDLSPRDRQVAQILAGSTSVAG